MGVAIALQAVKSAKDFGLVGFLGAAAAGAVAGIAFNLLMQRMMQSPSVAEPEFGPMPEVPTMDMGGRFIASRSYDMGGRYTQEHGLAVLKQGETVIPKTQNMLGSGITLNMGDVHVQDGEDFADRVAVALPSALRRVDETGGI